MIRFVDLTLAYWTEEGPPCCAFLDTVTDRFVEVDGVHVFFDLDEVRRLGNRTERFVGLIPDGFFKKEMKLR